MRETSTLLEALLVLLDEDGPPDVVAARNAVDEHLDQDPCVLEKKAAIGVTTAILNQLVQPALSGDQKKADRVAAMVKQIEKKPSAEAGWEKDLKDASAWMSALAVDKKGNPSGIPPAFSSRLLMALRLFGESEPWILQQVETWERSSLERLPWNAVEALLVRIADWEKKPAPPIWRRQRRRFHEAMITIADGCATLLDRMDRDGANNRGEGGGLPPDLRSKEGLANPLRLRQVLQQQGSALKHHSRSLAARMAENRANAERLRKRLDQLENALSEARTSQFIDPATGLPDRSAFAAHLKRHLERAVHLGEMFSLALFHLDDFQTTINVLEAEGESRLLKALIAEMQALLPPEAFLARLSEERLVILFPKWAEKKVAKVAGSIAGRLADTRFQVDQTEVVVAPFFGTAAFQPGMSAARMLAQTDRLTAAARSHGPDSRSGAGQRLRVC